MATPNKVGGYVFRNELVQGRKSAEIARQSLRTIIDERTGPQATAMLIARAALALSEIDATFRKIEEIAARR
jgi:hypothetical protein